MQLKWNNLSEDVRRRNPHLKQLLQKEEKRPERRPVITTAQWDAQLTVAGIRITMPEIPPSLNEWKGWHHMRQHKYKQDLYEQMERVAMAFRLPRIKLATVLITYYFPDRRARDIIDNYAPKFLMDALVHAGILADDRSDWVEVPRPAVGYDRQCSRVEVVINRRESLHNDD